MPQANRQFITFTECLRQAIATNDYAEILRLRRLHSAYQFSLGLSNSFLEITRAANNLSEQLRRAVGLDGNPSQNTTLKSVHLNNFLHINRLLMPEPGATIINPASNQAEFDRYTLWHINNTLRIFEAAIRIAYYVREENKNINNTFDLIMNGVTTVAATLALVTTISTITLPFSGVALAAIANLANLARNTITMGRSLFRFLRTNNMESAQEYAKEFVGSTLRVVLIFTFASLLAAGPYGLIVGAVLLTLLAMPDVRNFLMSIPFIRKIPEKISYFFTTHLPNFTHIINVLTKPVRKVLNFCFTLLDYAIQKASQAMVCAKLYSHMQKRATYAADKNSRQYDPTIIQMRSNSIPTDSFRSELKTEEQKDLNQVLKDGASQYLSDSVRFRLNRLTFSQRRELFTSEEYDDTALRGLVFTKDNLQPALDKLQDIRSKTTKIKKIKALAELYNKSNQPEGLSLRDFHRLLVRLGSYQRQDNHYGKDLVGSNQSLFSHTAKLTRDFNDLFQVFRETSSAEQFGNDLSTLIQIKIDNLRDTFFEKRKKAALTELHDLLLRETQTDTSPKDILVSIQTIENAHAKISFGFIHRSETKQLFDYAKTYITKRGYERDNQRWESSIGNIRSSFASLASSVSTPDETQQVRSGLDTLPAFHAYQEASSVPRSFAPPVAASTTFSRRKTF